MHVKATHARTVARARPPAAAINVCVRVASAVLGARPVCAWRVDYEWLECLSHVEDACLPNPCLNGGRCVPNSVGGFSCVCVAPFTGLRCEECNSEDDDDDAHAHAHLRL